MTRPVVRLGMTFLLSTVAIPVVAAESETPWSSVGPPPSTATYAPLTILQHGSLNPVQNVAPGPVADESASGDQPPRLENRLKFVTGEEMNEFSRQMKVRLTDPEQRAALRAEQRATVVSQTVGVGRSVGLDPVMEQKLIELLTDQQMERLEQMHLQPRATMPSLQKFADDTTQRMNALAELLGEEKLARFQDFEKSQSGRHWVNQLSARLAPADALQPDQVDRLTALKQEQFDMTSASIGSLRAFRRSSSQPNSIEDMQRGLQQQARIANESSWRRRQIEHRVIEEKAAAFLSPAQLAELAKYQAQEQDNLRRSVEAARAEAGLDPKIPEQPEQVEQPKRIDAHVQIEVSLTVNGEPTTVVTRTVRSGEPFTFEAAQGLIAEATPTMFDDNWVDVHLKYYEEGPTGRRRLSGGSISTTQVRPNDGASIPGGGSGTVIMGRKGYAVETTINATAL